MRKVETEMLFSFSLVIDTIASAIREAGLDSKRVSDAECWNAFATASGSNFEKLESACYAMRRVANNRAIASTQKGERNQLTTG
jgi:hypothetical protein